MWIFQTYFSCWLLLQLQILPHLKTSSKKKKIDEETKDEDKQIIRRVLADCPYIWFAWTTYWLWSSGSPLHALPPESAKVTPFVPEKQPAWANSYKQDVGQGELRHQKYRAHFTALATVLPDVQNLTYTIALPDSPTTELLTFSSTQARSRPLISLTGQLLSVQRSSQRLFSACHLLGSLSGFVIFLQLNLCL